MPHRQAVLHFASELKVSVQGSMAPIPRYRPHSGLVILSAGFRPFFLVASIWAAVGIPLWLAMYAGEATVPSRLEPLIWHVHEMVFGFAAATVAGFLLTSIPNWTGRMPLQGGPLAMLVALWAAGRIGVLLSGLIGAPAAAAADLSFPTMFLAVVAREILAGKNWRNLPMLGALSLLLTGNLLVHLQALGLADTARLGNRIGVATLLMLISLVGGRIIPSFTRNWLKKNRPEASPPASGSRLDLVALIVTAFALAAWAAVPNAAPTTWCLIVAGMSVSFRLARWQGLRTTREPLLFILHVGYGWLAGGLLVVGLNGLFEFMPETAVLHTLTAGAIGTMTLAVMSRASLGHTGRPLTAGPATKTIYVLVNFAAVLRVLSPLAGAETMIVLWLAGATWTAAFGLFAIVYGRVLTLRRVTADKARLY